MGAYLALYKNFEPAFESFDNSMLGPEFRAELDLVSRLCSVAGIVPASAPT